MLKQTVTTKVEVKKELLVMLHALIYHTNAA
jgi:hypothetical protein